MKLRGQSSALFRRQKNIESFRLWSDSVRTSITEHARRKCYLLTISGTQSFGRQRHRVWIAGFAAPCEMGTLTIGGVFPVVRGHSSYPSPHQLIQLIPYIIVTSTMSSAMSSTLENVQVEYLSLFISTAYVGLYPPPPPVITNDTQALFTTLGVLNQTPSSDLTGLLIGPLNDFLLYSSDERSQWLIDISHDICDPRQKRGQLQVWDVTIDQWRVVDPSEHLIAARYLYDIQVVVSLSKISRRDRISVTSATGYASTMANRVKTRDSERCWVSSATFSNVNSHVCPKRMGDHLLCIIYRDFVSTPPPTLSIYDEICGITLAPVLDCWFDTYELGLRFMSSV